MRKTDKPPSHLSREAASWWRLLRSEYGIVDGGGVLHLQTSMEAFDRMRQSQRAIKEHGLYIMDKFQQMKINPACQVERDARAQMLMALKALNLDIEVLRDAPGRPPGK